MADKYTSISPYAYCAWNPVKLFDPNGLDTFNYDLQSGNMISYIIEQEGKHCINFYVGDNLVGSCGELGGFISTEQSTWNIDDVQGSTDYLIFTDGESGKKVFDLISSLAKDADTRSDVEWDYYLLKNGSGELSTSHQKDMMVHDPNKYLKGKASSWDHYHPFINSYSWFPGNSPQISFGPNDRTTMDLKGQQGVNDARQMAIDNIKNGNFDIVSKSWQYGQDQFYEGIKEGNVVTSFLGSYNTTVSISPGNNEGEYILNFEVNNTSSWESATRLRRDHDGNGNHDAIIPSKARGAGIKLGGNFRQTWRWSETINVQ